MTFDYEYYDNGMLESITYPNQVVVANYTYDDANRLDTLTNVLGSENLLYSYGYDANSNITSVNDNGSITNYQYDPLNRLETINRLYNDQSIQYGYDNLGNRAQEIANFTPPYPTTDAQFVYNVLNQLSQFNDNYFYQYDYKGSRTEKKKIDEGYYYRIY
ncbi:MAG: hypothetical protein AAGU27_22155 [Dehalobacterium sp.]